MSKPLDRHTKSELIALVNRLQDENHTLSDRVAQGAAKLHEAYNQLDALESRRRHEGLAYARRARSHTPGAIRDAARAYCAAHGVASCTKEQALAFANQR